MPKRIFTERTFDKKERTFDKKERTLLFTQKEQERILFNFKLTEHIAEVQDMMLDEKFMNVTDSNKMKILIEKVYFISSIAQLKFDLQNQLIQNLGERIIKLEQQQKEITNE
jgi:hypothetical protein